MMKIVFALICLCTMAWATKYSGYESIGRRQLQKGNKGGGDTGGGEDDNGGGDDNCE